MSESWIYPKDFIFVTKQCFLADVLDNRLLTIIVHVYPRWDFIFNLEAKGATKPGSHVHYREACLSVECF